MAEGTSIDKLIRALVGVILFQSAYVAEVVRGGLQALPKGQYEAAESLALGYWKTQGLVILPQALKLVIPGLVNTIIALFKDTSLVIIIGLFDLFSSVQQATVDPAGHAMEFFNNLKLAGQRAKIAEKILKEIGDRLKFLVNVGLNYLTLSRSAETLSGGEAQRIRLASQIGAGLVGVMYVLDEPSIGLHQRDNERLLGTLIHLRDLGNTVIVVEHDEDAIRAADHVIDIGPGAGVVIDIGPGAGVHGGEVVAEGPLEAIMAVPESLTGQYMSGKRKIEVPKKRVPANPEKVLKLTGARGNNLKDVTLTLPVGLFTCITGVSGSGKSTLINDTLFPIARAEEARSGKSGKSAEADRRTRQQPERRDADAAGGSVYLHHRGFRFR